MAVSFMSFCNYLPYILVSIFGGTFIDRSSKKKILIISDTIAAVCTISILFSLVRGSLALTQIYVVNAVIGFMNAFQSPAAAVVTGQLITDGNYEKASGLNSFSSNLIMVTAPVLSGTLVGFFGVRLVLALNPMILARSGGNAGVFGLVNSMMGAGGIIGGIIVASGKKTKSPYKMIYLSAGISFLLGDFTMGAGRNVFAWSAAGIFASLPIPFIMAGQNALLYRTVPENIQGRIFAIRNGIQYSTVPIGLLLGGYLADYVFEPFMASDYTAAVFLQNIVGKGAGSGMAVMFLCTGLLGALSSVLGYKNRSVRNLTSST